MERDNKCSQLIPNKVLIRFIILAQSEKPKASLFHRLNKLKHACKVMMFLLLYTILGNPLFSLLFYFLFLYPFNQLTQTTPCSHESPD